MTESYWTQIFRVFIPSFGFFATIEARFEIQARMATSDRAESWVLVNLQPEWSLSNLFLNPKINFDFAIQNQLERLCSEPESRSSQTTLMIIENYIRSRFESLDQDHDCVLIGFKVLRNKLVLFESQLDTK